MRRCICNWFDGVKELVWYEKPERNTKGKRGALPFPLGANIVREVDSQCKIVQASLQRAHAYLAGLLAEHGQSMIDAACVSRCFERARPDKHTRSVTGGMEMVWVGSRGKFKGSRLFGEMTLIGELEAAVHCAMELRDCCAVGGLGMEYMLMLKSKLMCVSSYAQLEFGILGLEFPNAMEKHLMACSGFNFDTVANEGDDLLVPAPGKVAMDNLPYVQWKPSGDKMALVLEQRIAAAKQIAKAAKAAKAKEFANAAKAAAAGAAGRTAACAAGCTAAPSQEASPAARICSVDPSIIQHLKEVLPKGPYCSSSGADFDKLKWEYAAVHYALIDEAMLGTTCVTFNKFLDTHGQYFYPCLIGTNFENLKICWPRGDVTRKNLASMREALSKDVALFTGPPPAHLFGDLAAWKRHECCRMVKEMDVPCTDEYKLVSELYENYHCCKQRGQDTSPAYLAANSGKYQTVANYMTLLERVQRLEQQASERILQLEDTVSRLQSFCYWSTVERQD